MPVSKPPAGPYPSLSGFRSPISQGPSKVVAVVDDDEDVREVLSALFELRGHDVKTYDSAKEFLQEAVLDHLECLVVDLKMPTMTGLELVVELESRGIAIPTLLITGANDESVRRQAADFGVMAVMQKPMCHHRLLQFVSASLS